MAEPLVRTRSVCPPFVTGVKPNGESSVHLETLRVQALRRSARAPVQAGRAVHSARTQRAPSLHSFRGFAGAHLGLAAALLNRLKLLTQAIVIADNRQVPLPPLLLDGRETRADIPLCIALSQFDGERLIAWSRQPNAHQVTVCPRKRPLPEARYC
jgi:hypothetical protein